MNDETIVQQNVIEIEDRMARLRVAVLVLALLGVAFMAYLTYIHYKPSGSAVCNFGDGFSCDLVNKSVYAELFGVPLSILGLGYFATVAAMTKRAWFNAHVGLIQAATVASLVFGAYLSWIEVYMLGSICLFCELSKVVMLLILVAATLSMRRLGLGTISKWTPYAALAGGLMIVASNYSSVGLF